MTIFLWVLAAIAIAASVAVFSVRKYNDRPGFCLQSALPGAAGIAFALLAMSLTIVPTGYVGIKVANGQVSSDMLPAGVRFHTPIIASIEAVNIKQQDAVVQGQIWGETSDRVPVFMENVTIAYLLEPEQVIDLKKSVTSFPNVISVELVSSALKNASRGISAQEVTRRSSIEPVAAEELQLAVDKKYGEGKVHIVTVIIGNMDFEPAYNDAIAKRNEASLAQETQTTTNATNEARAISNAAVTETNAQAAATAKLIAAEAEAEANAAIAASLTPEVLQNKYLDVIRDWRPLSIGGSDAQTMLPLPLAPESGN